MVVGTRDEPEFSLMIGIPIKQRQQLPIPYFQQCPLLRQILPDRNRP
jgi:hypothetical protein